MREVWAVLGRGRHQLAGEGGPGAGPSALSTLGLLRAWKTSFSIMPSSATSDCCGSVQGV
jgi:hypothetical protein